MDPHVYSQLTALVEPCSTLVTPKGFLLMVISVGPHVVPDVALERLATNVALVKLFVLMERQDVSFQCVGPGVSLVAEVALVLARSHVHLHVGLEVSA